MNILFVTPYLPYPPVSGGRLQTFLRLKYLKKRGHSIFLMTLALPGDNENILELRNIIDDVKSVYVKPDFNKIKELFRKSLLYEIFTFDSRFGKELKTFAEDNKIDVAVFEGLGVAQYRDFISDIPAVLYEHNVEYEITGHLVSYLRRSPGRMLEGDADEKFRNLYLYLFGGLEKRLVRDFESASMDKFDLVVTCSERDAEIIKKDMRDVPHIITIPWGVEAPAEYNRPKEKDSYSLFFLGSMKWEPNRDAVTWFVNEILPLVRERLKNVGLVITGSSTPKNIFALNNQRDIIVKGFVPDVSALYLEADIFVAPLRLGSGVNVKVLEAMSYGMPVITTSKGAEGIGARDEEHFMLADTPEEFLSCITRLINNLEARRSLGERARKYILLNNGTDKITSSFEDALNSCVKSHG